MEFKEGDIVTSTFYTQLKGGYCRVINSVGAAIRIKVLFVSNSRYDEHVGRIYFLSSGCFKKVENMVE